MKPVGELSTTCSQIVLKCLYLARIGRPDILWSVNKLARSITKWTKACDKRLNRLISYIHHTSEYKQYCHVGNTAKQCRFLNFSDSVLCLGEIHEKPQSNTAWEQRLEWFKSTPECRNFDRIDGQPMEFEWNIFPGFNTLQLSPEVQELLLRLNETPENFTGRIIFMSMFNDISWGSKENKIECESNAQLVSLFARRFGAGHWSFLGPGSEKKWYCISEDSPLDGWDKK